MDSVTSVASWYERYEHGTSEQAFDSAATDL